MATKQVPAFRPANTKKQATPLKTTKIARGSDSVPGFQKRSGDGLPAPAKAFSPMKAASHTRTSEVGHRAGFTKKVHATKATTISNKLKPMTPIHKVRMGGSRFDK